MKFRVVFEGDPDDDVQTLLMFADERNDKFIPTGTYARWISVSKQNNVWALELDVVPVDRRKIVALIIDKATDGSRAVETVEQNLSDNGCIVIRRGRDTSDIRNLLPDEHEWEELDRNRRLQFDRIELADEVFVVNLDGHITEEQAQEIEFAESLGKRIKYLNYGQTGAVK